MNEKERINYRSSRNGLITAFLLLAVFTVYRPVTKSGFPNETFGVLLISMTVFWGTRFVYSYQA